MQMPSQTVSELELANNTLRERNDALVAEIKDFLKEVGAPSMTSALERYRRFATAAIELPKRLQARDHDIKTLTNAREMLSEKMARTTNECAKYRQRSNVQAQLLEVGNRKLAQAKAAAETALDIFSMPMLSAFLPEMRPAVQALSAVVRDITETQETADAKI